MSAAVVDRQRRAVLAWFEPRRLVYPWRLTRHAYPVLVSEVMLQQTQAARVAPAFERFLDRFPLLETLARSPRAAVLEAWDGLGYNRRAISLWRAAGEIVRAHDGVVPRDPGVLRALPGIGPYTAAAVASIAYDVPVAAVDTNVHRVVRRVVLGRDDADDAAVERSAAVWLDRRRPGLWNQAVMDLGRAFCRPRPRCEGCPLRATCAFALAGVIPASRLPRQPPFAGSMRQVRGDVVRALRAHPSATIATIASAAGHPHERITEAVTGLVADGIVDAGPAALAGSRRGRIRLAR